MKKEDAKMKHMKKLIPLLLAFAMFLSLTACGNKSDSKADQAEDGNGEYADVLIGLILPLGGLGDNSVGDGCYNGVKLAQEELGFEFDYSEPQNEQDREAVLVDYCDAQEYDLIITVGDESLELVKNIQPNYPDQKFLVYNPQDSVDNTIAEYFSKTDMGFMAGAFMALMEPYGELTINGKTYTWEPSNKVGLIVGGEYPSTVSALTSAAAGAKYVNPDMDYMYGIVGSWTDQAKNKELALSMYNEGCSFIFHNSGAGSAGLISAAEEAGKFVVGYDVDQTTQSETVVASACKNHEDVILRVMTEFCEKDGDLAWGTSEINDCANGGVIFTYREDADIPEEVKTAIDEIRTKLEEKEITVPTTWDEVDSFNDVFEQ